MIAEDTSGNGRLGTEDRTDLYVTDLDGLRLSRVLDDRFTVTSAVATDSGKRILVYAFEFNPKQRTPEQDLRQWAFVYDRATDQWSPHKAINSLTDRAGRVIGK